MPPPSPLAPQNSLNDHIQSSENSREQGSALGPFFGVVIILFLLALGALYFWGERLNNQEPSEELSFIIGDAPTQ